jgi:hypothetical protein
MAARTTGTVGFLLTAVMIAGGLAAVTTTPVEAAPKAAAVTPPADPILVPRSGGFVPVAPERILDTRAGFGASGRIGPGGAIDLQVAGRGGVPLTGVDAVALNVTVTEPTAVGFVTAYPAGTTRPLASNLNIVPGQTVPNAVVVKLGTLGRVTFYNSSGTTHLIADVAGWYASTPDVGESYRSLAPTRLIDTRQSGVVPAGGTVRVPATADLPGGITAVALNVTYTGASNVGFLTAYPAGDTRPLASNLNLVAGGTHANFVAVPIGVDGSVDIYASAQTHVVVDRLGYWGGAANGRFTAMAPVRVVDTRTGLGGRSTPLGSGGTMDVDLSGVAGVPEGRPSGVVLNVTSVNATAGGYVTVHPTGQARPLASNLNFVVNETVPNLVMAAVNRSGRASFYNNAGLTDIVVDVVGWFDRPVFTLPKAGVSGRDEGGVNPADVVIDPSSTFAFITNPVFNRVEVLRLATGTFETPIPVGSAPMGIDISPAGDRIYVANRGGTQVSVVDVAGRVELKRVQISTPNHLSNQPYSLAALANGHLLVATTFSGSGFGAAMFDVNLADDTARLREDFYYWGSTTERTQVRASGDRQHAVVIAGDISSGPVFRYDVSTDTFTPEFDLGSFHGHVATNATGSWIFVNGGGYVVDKGMQLAGTATSCRGAGVAMNADGSVAYSLGVDSVAICDVQHFLAADRIYTFDLADWYPYLNNHAMELSPDGSTLVGLTDSGVTLIRL